MCDAYDFNINVEKIEREADLAVQKESKYWRENDAKLRAVHQKVGSYEEFKNIVAASHLKPLNKNENLGQITRFGKSESHWNNSLNNSTKKLLENDYFIVKNPIPLNRNKDDLINMSPPSLYDAMHNLYQNNELKIFHPEIQPELLTRYCAVILGNSELSSSDAMIDWNILLYIGQRAGRLTLSMNFMNSEERLTVKQSIDHLKSKLSDETISKIDLLQLFSL